MAKRNLILIHRGPEYQQDFREIARKVTAIDKDITVYSVASSSLEQLPPLAWLWPTLIVALTPQYRLRVDEVRVFYDVSRSTVETLAIVAKSEAETWLAQFGSPE